MNHATSMPHFDTAVAAAVKYTVSAVNYIRKLQHKLAKINKPFASHTFTQKRPIPILVYSNCASLIKISQRHRCASL